MIRIGLFLLFICLYRTGAGQNAVGPNQTSPEFAENKLWEKRIRNTQTRSQSRPPYFRLLSPEINQRLPQGNIRFAWQGEPESKLFLGLLNNRNQKVVYTEVKNQEWVLFQKGHPLPPGRYYWVLETENETVLVGKFFIIP